MISSNDFRSGVSIVIDGTVWRIVESLHVKPVEGEDFVRTKLKSVRSGSVVERIFRAGETVPRATLEKLVIYYDYKDADDYVFIDLKTYEEFRVTDSLIGDPVKYLKQGMEVIAVLWEDQILEVELPNTVVLEVIQIYPGVTYASDKPAVLETGATVMVPCFISQGERIKIDTRDGTFLGRE